MRRSLVSLGLVFLTGLALLLVGLHLAAPWLMRTQLQRALGAGQLSYLGEVDLNLFSGLLAIDGLVLGPPQRPWLRLEEARLELDTGALLRGRLRVRRLDLARGYWRVRRRPDGGLDTGLPAAPAGQGQASVPPPRVDAARLARFRLIYEDPATGLPAQVIRLRSLSLEDLDPAASTPASLHLRARWGAARLGFDGGLRLAPRPRLRGRLDLRQLPLRRVLRLARRPLPLGGRLDARLDLRASPGALRLAGRAAVGELAYRLARTSPQAACDDAAACGRLRIDTLGLERLRLSLDPGDPGRPRLSAPSLSLSGLHLQDGAYRIDLDSAALQALDLHPDRAAWRVQGEALQARGLALSGEAGDLALDRLRLEAPALSLPREADARPALSGGDLSLTGVRAHQAGRALSLGRAAIQGAWRYQGGRWTQAGLRLDVQGLALDDPPRALTLEAGLARLDAGELDPARATARGGAQLTGLRFQPQGAEGEQLSLAGLSLEGLDWDGARLRLREAALDGLALRRYPLRLARAELAASTLSASDWALGRLTLHDLRLGLSRDVDGHWQRPRLSAPATSGAGAADPARPRWRLAGLRLAGDNRVHLVDRHIQPPLDRELRIARLELGALDSGRPGQDTPLDLNLVLDRYSHLGLQARLRPFARPPAIEGHGTLSGLHLPLVNGLVADQLGHRFVEGELSDRFKLRIARHRLHMRNHLELNDLEVDPIPGRKGPPLSLAAALLEDRQGRITLDVPIDGDLSRPDFHVLGALDPIIMKAVAGTAALAIQPLGSVILVGGLLADAALQVRFQPVGFQAGASRPRAGMEARLRALGKKLADRPKLRLRLCGVAVASDRGGDKKDDAAAMLKLAEQRAAWVRRVLLETGVASGQLRACRPRIDDTADGRPRVEIRL